MRSVAFVRLALTAVLLAGSAATHAQDLPAGPLRAFDGRLIVGGEIVATAGQPDSIAFFNYTDYEHNALRLFRLALSGEWRPVPRVAFIGELRSEDLDQITPHAAYIRVRPWTERRFDIQAGRIPPAFGAFGRRAYTTSDGLIGYPLAYQYLTSLRPDAAPMTANDLLSMRARGWRSEFPLGNREPSPGVPLVSAFRWDTGVQAHWASDRVTVTGAVTNGTLSTPRVTDNNDGKQISGRVSFQPLFGLVVGASGARGAWLSRDVSRLLPDDARSVSHAQTATGADVEYSRGHWLVRAETIWSEWHVPITSSSSQTLAISALGAFVEGRYRFSPRIFAAARVDGLTFSSITGTMFNGRPTPWDAPVRRVEITGGYAIQRNLTARVSLQHNRRNGGRVTTRTFLSGQLAYWF